MSSPTISVPTRPKISWLEQCLDRGAHTLEMIALRLDRTPEFDMSEGAQIDALSFTIIPKLGVKMSRQERDIIDAWNEVLEVGRVGGRLVLERPGFWTEQLVLSDEAGYRIRNRLSPFTGWRPLSDEGGIESNDFLVLLKVKQIPRPRSYRSIPRLEQYPEPMFIAELKSFRGKGLYTPANLGDKKLQLVSDKDAAAVRAIGLSGLVRFAPVWAELVDPNTTEPLGCFLFL